MVIEVVDQFILEEVRFKSNWTTVTGGVVLGANGAPGTITDLWLNNRFLQIVVLPYASSGDHDCYVSIRNVLPPETPLKPDPNKNDPFSLACRLQPLEKSAVVLGIIAAAAAAALTANAIAAAADAAAAAVSWIPFVGEAAIVAAAIADAAAVAADAAAAAVAVALAPLLVPSITIGDYIAAVTNLLTDFGLMGVAEDTVNALLSSELGPHDVIDLSYHVMDTYDYEANCYKAKSLEVAFNADEATYVSYVEKLFELIDQFASQDILYGGYISLRYCGRSDASLAIERWEHTVCLEMSSLSGLNSEMQVLRAFEAAAADLGATIHWGQLNNRTRADIEVVFADTISTWRRGLLRTSREGALTTFDNDFCSQRGLEVYDDVARRPQDLSYLIPLIEN
jgi:hypothetical protein